jgi:septal ring factor EnvC (AmiA/AmiB activator)
MRVTLHDIKGMLSARDMEADNLREQIGRMSAQLSNTVMQLVETQRQLRETDSELHDAQLQLAHVGAQIQTTADKMPSTVKTAVKEGLAEAAEQAAAESGQQMAVRPEGGSPGGSSP